MSRDRKRETAAESRRLARKLRLLPARPGVYLHKDARGRVLYVGKAVRLNQRVRSYFQDPSRLDPKTRELVRRIRDLDVIVTPDETTALVLEDRLIKEYRPPYNIRLKDDKRYPYLRITVQEPFPRIEVVRRVADDGARYFGPFTNAGEMRETLRYALQIFPVRTCRLALPQQKVPRACLDHQIGRCSAPCVGLDDRRGYRRKVRDLIRFLEGRDRDALRRLRDEMQAAAAAYDFETAARARDRLRLLERTLARRFRIAGLRGDVDACGLARDGDDACGVVLRIRGGAVLTTHHFLLEDRLAEGPPALLAQLLREYYGRSDDIPATILLPEAIPDTAHWEIVLAERRGRPVRLVVPRRGPRRDAVAMAASNAAVKLNERQLQGRGTDRRVGEEVLRALQERLGLRRQPLVIECFDISTFQGRETVAALVTFRDGKPWKTRYRRFRVRTVEGTDDFASLREVVGRHYRRLGEREGPPADLVVIDGGAGQVAAARQALTELGLHETELIGLAKREELIVREDGPPLRLSRHDPALQLLQRIRDEAHRFAINYHRRLRGRSMQASVLDRIPGIGPVKKMALLHHFDSVEAIRRAGAEQLCAVRGIGRADAERILAFFAAEGRRET